MILSWPLPRLSPLIAAAALLASCLAAPAAEMTFRLVDFGNSAKCGRQCPQVIAAEGEITSRTPRAFVEFVEANIGSGRLHAIVLLHSQGGQVTASMELGQAMRQLGAAAIVARSMGNAAPAGHLLAGRCYSACVYALMGATKRVVPPQSRVGIHRMFMFEANRSPDSTGTLTQTFASENLVERLGEYAAVMGVSSELVWTAEKVNPDKIRILSDAEVRRWKLAGPKF